MHDLNGVRAVTRRTMPLINAHLGNPHIPDMHDERFAVQSAGRGEYLAAWRDGRPVGNVLLHFRHPPHHASHDRYPDCAYVEALDVAPSERRQGHATALMLAAEARAAANGASLVGLSVGVGNAAARALYRKLGYAAADMPDYYVSWTYLDPQTREPMEEGEMCSFWMKALS